MNTWKNKKDNCIFAHKEYFEIKNGFCMETNNCIFALIRSYMSIYTV